jgi:hypothetical protein
VKNGTNRAASAARIRTAPWSEWVVASAALVIGAVLVLVSLTGYYLTDDRYSRLLSRWWDGAELEVLAGQGAVQGRELVVSGFDRRSQAVLRVPFRSLDAERLGIIRIDTSDRAPRRTQLILAWTDQETPTDTRTFLLPPFGPGLQEVALTLSPDWGGTVEDLWIIVGSSVPHAVTIHRVELLPAPPTAAGILRQVWREWTAFEGWRGHSINFIGGGHRLPLVPPAFAAILWLTFSASFFATYQLARRRRLRLVHFGVILLAGWLLLDARWQVDLWRQLHATHQQYAGKGLEEKRLAAEDREIFILAEEVKRRLPAPPARVLIVSPTPGSGSFHYIRVRLHYLLLPHNVSSVWDLPPVHDLKRGDHIVILRPHPRIRYDAGRSELRWGSEQVLNVDRLMTSFIGDLYRTRW